MRTRIRRLHKPRRVPTPNHTEPIPLVPIFPPYVIRTDLYCLNISVIRSDCMQGLQVSNEDAFELRAVCTAIWLAYVVDDACAIREVLYRCVGYFGG